MAIDFTLTPDQQVLQESARDFAENILRPVVREADEEPDPLRGFSEVFSTDCAVSGLFADEAAGDRRGGRVAA